MKDVDFGRTNIIPWPFVFSVALKENAKQTKILWTITKVCLNVEFLPVQWKNYQTLQLQGNLWQTLSLHGPMTWKVVQRNAWKNVANLQIKQLNSYTKSQRHAWMTIMWKKKIVGSVGELSKVYSQIVLKCLYWGRIGGPDLLMSVNKLASAIIKWTRQLLTELFSFDLLHSSHMWIQTMLSCVKYSTTMQIKIVSRFRLCRKLGRFKINIRWTFVHFWKSNICTNKLDVQETDCGLTQLNRSRAKISWCRFTHGWNTCSWCLGFGSWSLSLFSNPIKENQGSSRDTTSNKHTQNHTEGPTKHNNLELSNVDYSSSNATSSLFGAMLYTFKDNEAMIKMIIEFRSPTMRHVSRTHRVALDWLFDRINLDTKIQIRYIDTKNQLADILTKLNFTRDEWSNLLHLFNISHFSFTSCAKNSSLISCSKKMAKRVQEQKEEERIVAKSKSTAMNLSSSVPASSSSAKNW